MTSEAVTASGLPIAVSVTCSHPPAASAPAGLSPFAARVLDQLSVTAWLPAALLMTNTYLLVGMYLVRDPKVGPTAKNLEDVVSAIDSKALGVTIAVLIGIVLADNVHAVAGVCGHPIPGGLLGRIRLRRRGDTCGGVGPAATAVLHRQARREAGPPGVPIAEDRFGSYSKAAESPAIFIEVVIAAGLEQNVPDELTAPLSDEDRVRAAAFSTTRRRGERPRRPTCDTGRCPWTSRPRRFPRKTLGCCPTRLGARCAPTRTR